MKTTARWMLVLAMTSALPATAATLQAGDWSLSVPAHCEGKAVASKVAEAPLYSAEDAAALAKNPMLTLKPDFSNMPVHWRVDFSACLGNADHGFATQLLILPVDAYLGIYATDRKPEAGMRKAFDELKTWNATAAPASAWPFIPFVDMSTIAVLGAKRLHSPDVDGARVLTQFTPDVGFLQSGALTYIYQGLSRDGSHYVLMTVPVRAPGLAADGAEAHWGFTVDDLYMHPDRRPRYAAAGETWLGEQRDHIEPSMKVLDAIASSVARRTR